ncbi:unnamed protein product [Cuscuta epithymum]|uniref:CCHC-type domain-containing protein n=1 Tax=Cuscuta epithymum TaxID=186058 RepID=A0AAV0DI47_9ASTE|nr:unnamed protein product [Cuscuta epithymum]
MEDIVASYKRMSMTEQGNELNFDEEPDEEAMMESEPVAHPVVAVVITDRKIKLPGFQKLMSSPWKPGKGMTIKEIGKRRYLLNFNHVLDMNRVIEDGHWLFERDIILLKAIQPDDIPESMNLFEASFWVQVHNAPFKYRNMRSARKIGNFLGSFIKFEMSQFEGRQNSYLWIRVCLDVRQPLQKGTNLTRDGVKHWVDFKYEKLTSFCFICGIIGHSDKFCPLKYEEGFVAEKMYGASLRAGGRVKTSPTGFYKWLSDGASSSDGYGSQRKSDLGREQTAESKNEEEEKEEAQETQKEGEFGKTRIKKMVRVKAWL